jgi:hypothetical protein
LRCIIPSQVDVKISPQHGHVPLDIEKFSGVSLDPPQACCGVIDFLNSR